MTTLNNLINPVNADLIKQLNELTMENCSPELLALGQEYQTNANTFKQAAVRMCNILAEVEELTNGTSGLFQQWLNKFTDLEMRQARRYLKVSRDPRALEVLKHLSIQSTIEYMNGSDELREIVDAVIASNSEKITLKLIMQIKKELLGEIQPSELKGAKVAVKKENEQAQELAEGNIKQVEKKHEEVTQQLVKLEKEYSKKKEELQTKTKVLADELATAKAELDNANIKIQALNNNLTLAEKTIEDKNAEIARLTEQLQNAIASNIQEEEEEEFAEYPCDDMYSARESALYAFYCEYQELLKTQPTQVAANVKASAEKAGFTSHTEGRKVLFTLNNETFTAPEIRLAAAAVAEDF